ncbi:MAG: SHOCT domain-containing protein [Gaiellaceae bacterium]
MSGGYDEPEPPAAPPAAAAPDYAAELQKLASLRDQGIIDDAEFEAKKKQILGI